MPSCYVVYYSRVQVTPQNFPIEQICTPMMFCFLFFVCVVFRFLYVLCVAVRMVSRSLVQRVNLYAIPQLLPILLPLWSRFVNICTERFWIQLSAVFLISHFHLKMWVMSFLQSNFFEKKQVSTSLHLQAINNTRPANIPPPPDSTVNWDSRSNRIWPSPCQSTSHYYEKGKVSAWYVT